MGRELKGSEMKRARAFTLVEILIVVVLLGVLAAIVIPALAGGTTSARRSTLAMNVHLLRRFIPVYTSHHLETSPGYPSGDRTADPTLQTFIDQATLCSKRTGETALRGSLGYPFGPYLSKIPENPFNNLDTIEMLRDGQPFPAAADDEHGWIYKAQTGEIRPGNSGTDDSGTLYYDY